MEDPKSMKQKLFNTESIGEYLKEYTLTMRYNIDSVSWEKLSQAFDAMKRAERIFVAGNGGSASIANHLACDFGKGAHRHHVHSLASNMAIVTALANDISYDSIFEEQLKMADLNNRDLLILISSSGNSPNILKAANYAKLIGSEIIGLCGFHGGELKKLATIPLHIDVNNYGIVEDCHQAIMHVLTQWYMKDVNGES